MALARHLVDVLWACDATAGSSQQSSQQRSGRQLFDIFIEIHSKACRRFATKWKRITSASPRRNIRTRPRYVSLGGEHGLSALKSRTSARRRASSSSGCLTRTARCHRAGAGSAVTIGTPAVLHHEARVMSLISRSKPESTDRIKPTAVLK